MAKPDPFYTVSMETVLARIDERLGNLHEDVAEVKAALRDLPKTYVSHEEFKPVQRLVYGLAGAVLLSVLGAILAMVIVR